MKPERAKQIADHHLNQWFNADPVTSRKGLREYVSGAIAAALYEEGCRTGTGPRDINNPVHITHCAPNHDQQ